MEETKMIQHSQGWHSSIWEAVWEGHQQWIRSCIIQWSDEIPDTWLVSGDIPTVCDLSFIIVIII